MAAARRTSRRQSPVSRSAGACRAVVADRSSVSRRAADRRRFVRRRRAARRPDQRARYATASRIRSAAARRAADVRAGPQHLARHRGQQLPGARPAEAGAALSARPPCAPTPGTSTGPPSALEVGHRRTASRRPPRRPNRARAAPPVDRRGAASTIDCATVRPPASARCTVAPSGLDVAASTNTPRPCGGGGVQQRPQRAEAQVRRGGHGVGGQRRVARPGRRRRPPSSSRCRRAWRRPAPARRPRAARRWCAPAPRSPRRRTPRRTPPAA